MTDRRPVTRLLFGGAGLLTLLGAAACSGDEPTTVIGASPVAAETTLAPIVTETAPPTPAAAPASPTVDGAALLQQAIDGLGAGYHFTTTVTVDGQPTLVADGDRIADGTRLSITANGATISYIILPTGTWVLPDGGEWGVLDTPPAATDPIVALRTPSAIALDGVDGALTRLTATVPASTIGLAGDAPTPLQVLLDSATLRTVSFATAVDGRPASVEAVIGPVADPTPITAPA